MTTLLLTALLATTVHADEPPAPRILTAIQEGQDVAFEFWYWQDHLYEVEFWRTHNDDPEETRVTTWITIDAEDAIPTGDVTCIHGDVRCYEKDPPEDCYDCNGDGFAECAGDSGCRETYTFLWRDACVPPGSVSYQIDRMDWVRLDVTDTLDPCLDEQADSGMPGDGMNCGNSGCASTPVPTKLGLIMGMLALGAALLRGRTP